MTNQEHCLAGICPDCGGPMKQWTQVEIDAAKVDLGMRAEDDDFCDNCEDCVVIYTDPYSDAARDRNAYIRNRAGAK